MNTLLYILAKEFGHKNLHVLHRLDKNTSGVCLFAKGSYNIEIRVGKLDE